MMRRALETVSASTEKRPITMPKNEGKKGMIMKAITALVVLVLLAAAVWAVARWISSPARQGYYAVFLSNGQAYFGTITKENDKSLELHNVFYIQKNADASQSQGDLTLLKLGNEVHGPEDMMEVYKNQVVFIEKLKSDGKVMKAIQNYQQK